MASVMTWYPIWAGGGGGNADFTHHLIVLEFVPVLLSK